MICGDVWFDVGLWDEVVFESPCLNDRLQPEADTVRASVQPSQFQQVGREPDFRRKRKI